MNQNNVLELGCSETEFNFSKLITIEMPYLFFNYVYICNHFVISVLFSVNANENANKVKLIVKM